jgi:hypothetical protein
VSSSSNSFVHLGALLKGALASEQVLLASLRLTEGFAVATDKILPLNSINTARARFVAHFSSSRSFFAQTSIAADAFGPKPKVEVQFQEKGWVRRD